MTTWQIIITAASVVMASLITGLVTWLISTRKHRIDQAQLAIKSFQELAEAYKLQNEDCREQNRELVERVKKAENRIDELEKDREQRILAQEKESKENAGDYARIAIKLLETATENSDLKQRLKKYES